MKFLLLLGCGMISVVATPRIAYGQGAIVRDFLTVWVLPVAILLPPFYAMVTPVPLLILTQWRVHRGAVYRRVFTASAIGLTYGAASLAFRAYPASFAGGPLGTGVHALTWTAAVASCEIMGEIVHNVLLAMAIKLSEPTARIRDLLLNREALQADLAEIDLGILITVVVAVDPALAVFAVHGAAGQALHDPRPASGQLEDRHQDRAAQRGDLGERGGGGDLPGDADPQSAVGRPD